MKINEPNVINPQYQKNKIKKVTLTEFIQDYQITSLNSFVNYLGQIWKDLARRSNDKLKGINKITFAKYYELPGLINERLFAVFDENRDNYLNLTEFIYGMTILFTESFNYLSTLIFNLYDFDCDGQISPEDVRVVLSYVPLNEQLYLKNNFILHKEEEFKDRVEAQGEIHKIINMAFGEKNALDIEEFNDVVCNKCSEIFLFILIFILMKKPFNEQTVKSFDCFTEEIVQCKQREYYNNKIAFPVYMNKFKLFEDLWRNKKSNSEKHTRPIISNLLCDIENNSKDEIVDNLRYINGNKQKDNNTKYEKVKEEDVLNGNKFQKDKSFHSEEEEKENNKELNSTIIASYEGYLYKMTNTQKLKKIWVKLIYKDIYYYKKKDDSIHQGMNNLSGVYIKENELLEYEGKKFYSFSILLPNKVNTYYSSNQNDYTTWITKLKKSINFSNINDLYDFQEVIGNGKFGIIKKGIHKPTGKEVAIKIINKSKMESKDQEMVKNEIDILKICQHPNIIEQYDINENEDNIYIIMEYCKGGDLFSYLERRGYKLPETRACEIIYKLCSAVNYLHSYGIIHRDLKPENIVMTSEDEGADIKLIDFGLSKFLGPGVKCIEASGTLTYISPEVLQQKFYDKSVDLWSIGIITYLLLCGCLPFDDKKSDEEIIRQTINEPVPYCSQLWKNLSFESMVFVDRLLQKNPKKRPTIKEILENEWFNKLNNIANFRRERKDIQNCNFNLYAYN